MSVAAISSSATVMGRGDSARTGIASEIRGFHSDLVLKYFQSHLLVAQSKMFFLPFPLPLPCRRVRISTGGVVLAQLGRSGRSCGPEVGADGAGRHTRPAQFLVRERQVRVHPALVCAHVWSETRPSAGRCHTETAQGRSENTAERVGPSASPIPRIREDEFQFSRPNAKVRFRLSRSARSVTAGSRICC